MQKHITQSSLWTPRVLIAFALCSFGALLGMFSLAATPPLETTRAHTSSPSDPRNFLNTVRSNADRLPPGLPLPASAQFSLNRQQDPSNSSSTAAFAGFVEMPLRPSG